MSADWDLVIEDEPAKKDILALLSDDIALRILAQNQVPVSPLILRKQHQITGDALENKIRQLLDLGLIVTVKSPGSDAGVAFRSLVHNVKIQLDPEGISVILTINGAVSPKTGRNLLRISRPTA